MFMYRREEILGYKWVLIARVSALSQRENTSIDKQMEYLEREVERAGGDVIKKYTLAESAATTDRESLSEIVEIAKEQENVVVGVWKLDRLSRANPWETIIYLNRLREAEAILYANTHGYFEWDDYYDFNTISGQAVFAREWYERIIEGGYEGQVTLLEQGKWPFGKAPHGYVIDDEQVISLTEEGKEINHDIARMYLECENMSKVHEDINNKYEKDVGISQVRNILSNRLILGELTVDGEVIARDENLRVIDRETFQEIQKIRKKHSSSPSDTRDIPEPIDRATYRFGSEYILGLMDSIRTQCRKCGSDLRPNGTTERWGTTVSKYACVSDDCSYEGPLLKQTEFDNLHHTLPIRCPCCPVTHEVEVESTPNSIFRYKYTCANCGTSFGLDESPDKLKAAMENPKLAFKWDERTDLSEVKKSENEVTAEPKETDQATLAAYCC
jgi:DNA invertase Pin-like site-specific DNA recombinase